MYINSAVIHQTHFAVGIIRVRLVEALIEANDKLVQMLPEFIKHASLKESLCNFWRSFWIRKAPLYLEKEEAPFGPLICWWIDAPR